MKKMIFALLTLGLLQWGAFAEARGVRVRGYTTKTGRYVPSHYRSSPDHSFHNNYSSEGNINPYTGKKGRKKQR